MKRMINNSQEMGKFNLLETIGPFFLITIVRNFEKCLRVIKLRMMFLTENSTNVKI